MNTDRVPNRGELARTSEGVSHAETCEVIDRQRRGLADDVEVAVGKSESEVGPSGNRDAAVLEQINDGAAVLPRQAP